MKIGVSVFIFTFSNIRFIFSASEADLTKVSSTSFIQTNALFSYLKEQSDDYVENLLQQALAAASLNRNLFDIEEIIGEDCQRTAKAIADMYEELPIVVEVDKVIRRSSHTAVLTLKNSSTMSNPAEFICKSIEEVIGEFLVLYPEFQHLKKVARLKISGRPYFMEIPKSPLQATEMFYRGISDLQAARIVTIGVFVDYVEIKNASDEGYVVAKTILTLAKRADLTNITQRLFTKIVTEISVKAVAEAQKENHLRKSSVQFISFFVNLYRMQTMERLNRAFTEDSTLKNEYEDTKNKFSGRFLSL
ncbi:hypothetical protein V9T40_000412 [Parthenolecanium corni]|uniref:Uncharacterized protein n=1 Tax=Parthenolecanium corni TaxID=536013 RepID=A0AAN9TDB0_9HEMI